ncbi:MAG: asparaginase domain-containing protein, partial [Aristaeellaceae bacterium]
MKRIALLATGGTIACRHTPDGLTPALHAEELLESVPRSQAEIVCRD